MTAVILIAFFCFLINIPFGIWRSNHEKFSLLWFVYIHVPVPLVIAIRLVCKINPVFIPLFIAMAVLGQYVGGRMKKRSPNQ